MQRRLSACSSQNSQTFLYATFYAEGKNKTSKHLQMLGLHKNSRCQMRHRNKEKNSFVSRHIHQDEAHLHQNKYQNLHQNQHSESLCSILMNECECLTLTKDLERRLEAAEIGCIRRIMRISWTEKKSNEEVMERAGYKSSGKDYSFLGT